MKKVKYDRLFTSSWKLLVKNLVLFVPHIITLLISFLLFIIYLAVSGILGLLIKNPAMMYDQVILHEQIKFLLGTYPVRSVLCFVIYVIVWILIDLFFVTMKYGMIKEVILKRKTSLYEGYEFAKRYYSTSLLIHVISFLLIYSPLILIATVFYIIASKTGSFILMTPWIIIAIILLLVFIYVAYMLVRMIFIYPVMTFEERGALKTIKKDFHYVKTHVGHTIITWILFAVVWFLFAVLRTPLGNIGNKAQNLFIVISVTILVLFFEGIIAVWEHLFIFRSYIEGKTPEKRKVFKEDTSWKELY